MRPAYLDLHASGELAERIAAALDGLADCRLCPRACGVDRMRGETGFCGAGRQAVVAAFNPHFGEEAVLVGQNGSGTVFFAGCNLGCRFCQNADISRDPRAGLPATPEELAGVMLDLQNRGCGNINFVTPSHVIPQILEALPVGIEHGLNLPLVYNTGAYDSVDALRLLDGVVDIYMPDVKIWDPALAEKYLCAGNYPERARRAVAEMHHQVGDLVVENGAAVRGLLVRHLVMPGEVAGTGQWMEFLAGLSKNTCLNLMDQYRPCAGADLLPPIDRMCTREEFRTAEAEAEKHGLIRLDDRNDRFWARFLE
ncbi:radical SAM protein [Pseudodesulfovibrio portus]|uniref:Radical SAM protein n=1 Tax=Pseudodesulfovibrio portus TaxID=231439 RepID=A0ABM8AS69_9BACT|nr:radical SAM protein [Pseudodesulfovibrio portus]BDQ34326.1 radical SAM protein [Pseudodesulfovibrio portus]